ncbi:hypothetical protein B0H19DRAFT_1273568 [Mycena capillaripes]|nr:hypothetical protein B0H19DRAFT_1273568 [Mycena capillaripes]
MRRWKLPRRDVRIPRPSAFDLHLAIRAATAVSTRIDAAIPRREDETSPPQPSRGALAAHDSAGATHASLAVAQQLGRRVEDSPERMATPAAASALDARLLEI